MPKKRRSQQILENVNFQINQYYNYLFTFLSNVYFSQWHIWRHEVKFPGSILLPDNVFKLVFNNIWYEYYEILKFILAFTSIFIFTCFHRLLESPEEIIPDSLSVSVFFKFLSHAFCLAMLIQSTMKTKWFNMILKSEWNCIKLKSYRVNMLSKLCWCLLFFYDDSQRILNLLIVMYTI